MISTRIYRLNLDLNYRDNAAMGPNSASPNPQPRSDSYGLARRDARGLLARLFLPG